MKIMINKKYIFNRYILIWIVIGLATYIYSILDIIFNNKSIKEYNNFKYLIVLIILILYVINYIKYNKSLKNENVV
jgi:hypothetical protein